METDTVDISKIKEQLESIDNLYDCYDALDIIEDRIATIKSNSRQPIPDYGELYDLDEFYNLMCERVICSNDGSGYYGTETEMSDLPYDFNKLFPDTFGKKYGFTHVIWFNK